MIRRKINEAADEPDQSGFKMLDDLQMEILCEFTFMLNSYGILLIANKVGEDTDQIVLEMIKIERDNIGPQPIRSSKRIYRRVFKEDNLYVIDRIICQDIPAVIRKDSGGRADFYERVVSNYIEKQKRIDYDVNSQKEDS